MEFQLASCPKHWSATSKDNEGLDYGSDAKDNPPKDLSNPRKLTKWTSVEIGVTYCSQARLASNIYLRLLSRVFGCCKPQAILTNTRNAQFQLVCDMDRTS
ncbi:hypothetical protein AAHC03_05039 [Spirometra sp. Aus1]